LYGSSEEFEEMSLRWSIAAWMLLTGLAGCATGPASRTPSEPLAEVVALSSGLLALDQSVNPAEAERVAVTALITSQALARDYRIVRPAWWHNALVNLRLKRRGLCCHWAEDMYRALRDLEVRSLEFHWGVARRGNLFREHNAVIAVERGGRWQDGLVLDPWRDSGRLVWAPARDDRYPWTLHPADPHAERLRCR
jgi:hypothetical protein